MIAEQGHDLVRGQAVVARRIMPRVREGGASAGATIQSVAAGTREQRTLCILADDPDILGRKAAGIVILVTKMHEPATAAIEHIQT
ncbi:MAG: hypothetical protein ACREPT_02110, partial [Rudaea sp.]